MHPIDDIWNEIQLALFYKQSWTVESPKLVF